MESPKHLPYAIWAAHVEAALPEIRAVVTRTWKHAQPVNLSPEDLLQNVLLDLLKWGRQNPTQAADPRVGTVDRLVIALAARIARAKSIDSIRHHHRSHRTLTSDVVAPSADPAVPNDRIQMALEEMISTLQSKDREILTLRFVDGMTLRQIAEIQGVSIQTIYRALRICLDRLREMIEVKGRTDPELRESLALQWPEIDE